MNCKVCPVSAFVCSARLSGSAWQHHAAEQISILHSSQPSVLQARILWLEGFQYWKEPFSRQISYSTSPFEVLEGGTTVLGGRPNTVLPGGILFDVQPKGRVESRVVPLPPHGWWRGAA